MLCLHVMQRSGIRLLRFRRRRDLSRLRRLVIAGTPALLACTALRLVV